MRLQSALLALAILFLFAACDSGEPNDEVDLAYLYVAQSVSGDAAARGNLDLRFEEADEEGVANRIVGTWDIDKLDGAGEIGPQTGEGKLRGVVREDGSVRIDLNPNIADQNVILTGSFVESDRSLLEGEWTYQPLGGSTSGEFEASQTGPLE